MLKTAGILLILGFCIWTGIYLSARVRNRVREIEKFIRLFTSIQTQIEYALTPTDVLLQKLSESAEFRDFSFIHFVKGEFSAGKPLESAWNGALQKYAATSALQSREKEWISAFSEAFGSTDKSGQSANCTFFITQLEAWAEELRKSVQSKSRLCYALGILSGIFFTILLI